MNFFKRFSSVFFCCVLFSSFFVVSVSAVDDCDYYSLPSVGCSDSSMAFIYPVTPSATGDGWSSSDSNRLRDIWRTLTDSSSGNSGSIAYCVWWIWNYLKDDIRSSLGDIDRNTSVVASRILDSNSLLGSINTAVSGIDGFATETTLSSFLNFWKTGFSDYYNTASGSFAQSWNTLFTSGSYGFPTAVDENGTPTAWYKDSWFSVIGNIYGTLFQDYKPLNTGKWSLYHHISNLSETLASEDDKQLAQNQKENREQAEQDFLSGKSGKTSLGKEDFGSLSGVGGTFKDITSLNGQASIGSFSDGLSSADEAGQGWFSQATKDSLDSVSDSSSNVSTFSVDGDYMEDADIYNMAGFEDHYAWLWGD